MYEPKLFIAPLVEIWYCPRILKLALSPSVVPSLRLASTENVVFASRILGDKSANAQKRAKELLEAVGLKDRMNYLPAKLSGGERQRVAIARAVANSPKVMLADEPTGNLDEDTAKSVMDILLALCKENKTALLLITHNPDFAKITDRQVVLSHGGIM